MVKIFVLIFRHLLIFRSHLKSLNFTSWNVVIVRENRFALSITFFEENNVKNRVRIETIFQSYAVVTLTRVLNRSHIFEIHLFILFVSEYLSIKLILVDNNQPTFAANKNDSTNLTQLDPLLECLWHFPCCVTSVLFNLAGHNSSIN